MHHYYQTFHQANFIVNDVSDVPVLTRARTLLPVNYLYLEESLANNGGGGAGCLAVFTHKSIPLKTQTRPRRSVLKKFLVPKTKQSVHERATQTETIGYNISISIRQVFEKNSNIELQFENFLKIF